MNLDEISKVAAIMQDYELTEFSIESDDMKLRMKRVGQLVPVAAPALAMPGLPPGAIGQGSGDVVGADAPDALGKTIDSPIVGTFYRSPAPDADPFVKPGDDVDEDTVVCIVEAMKVMNEIKAETRGIVKQVLLDNATPVEFGQPLIELQ